MTDKPYRIHITGGKLHDQHVTVTASDEWAAMAKLSKALDDKTATYTWPVYTAPGVPDLFGAAPEVPTITLDEALEALNADAR